MAVGTAGGYEKMSEESTQLTPTEATIKIPFETAKHAEIAYRVLKVDQEPRRNFVQKQLRLEDGQLVVHFTADKVKNLRTSISSFFEALLLCTDTIEAFTPSASVEPKTTNNARAHTCSDTA